MGKYISTDPRINAPANYVTVNSGQESGVFFTKCYNPAVMPKRQKVEPIRNPTLFEMETLEVEERLANSLNVERPYSEPGLLLGTSAFTAAGWEGFFYPAGMNPRDFLPYYATQFATVEVDSTFYGTPNASTVTGWYEKTPPDFLFALKVPRVVTHKKMLVDCEAEFDEFIDRMDLLKEKLGPLLLQFPRFSNYEMQADEFSRRLRFFLNRVKNLPTRRIVVEIRNRTWLDRQFADLLREYNVAFALTDTSFMPRPWEMKEKFDLVTTDFVDGEAGCFRVRPNALSRQRRAGTEMSG